jgi:hypothetical protein
MEMAPAGEKGTEWDVRPNCAHRTKGERSAASYKIANKENQKGERNEKACESDSSCAIFLCSSFARHGA